MTSAVAVAFATGLVGSFGHCAGMCGPLVGSFALAAAPLGARRALLGQLAYHAGRVTMYAAVGAATSPFCATRSCRTGKRTSITRR